MNKNTIIKYTSKLPVYLCVGLVLTLFVSCSKDDRKASVTFAKATGPYQGLPTGAEAALKPIYNADKAQAYTVDADAITLTGSADEDFAAYAGLVVTLTPVNGVEDGAVARISFATTGSTVPTAERTVFPTAGQFRIDSATGTTLNVTRLNAAATPETGFSAGTISLAGTKLTITFTIAEAEEEGDDEDDTEETSVLNAATAGTFTFVFNRNAAS